MKVALIIFSIGLLAFSCKKDNSQVPSAPNTKINTVSATINDSSWSASGSSEYVYFPTNQQSFTDFFMVDLKKKINPKYDFVTNIDFHFTSGDFTFGVHDVSKDSLNYVVSYNKRNITGDTIFQTDYHAVLGTINITKIDTGTINGKHSVIKTFVATFDFSTRSGPNGKKFVVKNGKINYQNF